MAQRFGPSRIATEATPDSPQYSIKEMTDYLNDIGRNLKNKLGVVIEHAMPASKRFPNKLIRPKMSTYFRRYSSYNIPDPCSRPQRMSATSAMSSLGDRTGVQIRKELRGDFVSRLFEFLPRPLLSCQATWHDY